MRGTIERVRGAMQEFGLSGRAVADQAGVSFSALARATRGDGGISATTDAALRRWLGDDVPELPPTIPMPVNRCHAEMMLLVAERYLADNPER